MKTLVLVATALTASLCIAAENPMSDTEQPKMLRQIKRQLRSRGDPKTTWFVVERRQSGRPVDYTNIQGRDKTAMWIYNYVSAQPQVRGFFAQSFPGTAKGQATAEAKLAIFKGDLAWPKFTRVLPGGRNVLRVGNPNNGAAAVGLRYYSMRRDSSVPVVMGKDFLVPGPGVGATTVPDGQYKVYFRFANKPGEVYQGDDVTLEAEEGTITIVQRVDGNYGIQRIK